MLARFCKQYQRHGFGLQAHSYRHFALMTRKHSPDRLEPHSPTRTTDSPYHFYQNKVLEPFLQQTIHANTLRQYITFGRQMNGERLIKSANWVRHELMIRLAHRIRDFQQLPFIIGTNPNIEWAYLHYWEGFEALRKTRTIKSANDNAVFCDLLEQHLVDGQQVVPQMILGASECASHYRPQDGILDHFLNRMMQAGVSRRILAEQHVALTKACSGTTNDRMILDSMAHQYNNDGNQSKHGNQVGIFNSSCSTKAILDQVQLLLANQYTLSPSVDIQIHGQDDITLAYIPYQLEQILYELVHNAAQHTLLRHKQSTLPSIRITVSANKSDVFFRISDQAGGIPLPMYNRLWSCQERASYGDFMDMDHMPKMPMTLIERFKRPNDRATRCVGIGLIMSRVYAEYWGGELQVISMDGYGTDAYVRIPRNGTIAESIGINTMTHAEQHRHQYNKNPIVTTRPEKSASHMIMHTDLFQNQKGWLPSTLLSF